MPLRRLYRWWFAVTPLLSRFALPGVRNWWRLGGGTVFVGTIGQPGKSGLGIEGKASTYGDQEQNMSLEAK